MLACLPAIPCHPPRCRYAWNSERGDPAQPYHYRAMVAAIQEAAPRLEVSWRRNGLTRRLSLVSHRTLSGRQLGPQLPPRSLPSLVTALASTA